MAECPKASRCIHGSDCPLGYEPESIWYKCFERKKKRTCLEHYSKAEIIGAIRIACSADENVEKAIQESLNEIELRKAPESEDIE